MVEPALSISLCALSLSLSMAVYMNCAIGRLRNELYGRS